MRAISLLMVLVSTLAQAADVAWHEFDVVISDHLGFGKERVALLLRAKINDVDCRVQLDTGAAATIIWRHRDSDQQPAMAVQARVRIGDIEQVLQAKTSQLVSLRHPDCHGVAATVGNGFFEHGTLHLDLGSQRFAFTPGAALARHPAAHSMLYLPATQGGGHPLIMAKLANGAQGYVLLDTGSMRFGLAATDPQQWRQLTAGLQGAPRRSFSIRNASEAGALTCEELETQAPMAIGGQTVRQELVTYCSGKQFQLAQPILGVLGLRPLGRRMVIIDYVSRRWLLGEDVRDVGE
ncbi:MAG TPA: hypothetical protein VEC35_18320 [Noviherbaspirillum sp.]|nr:hypothetical protein [Noviherbaspirillum sp.]